ncbi:MAG: translation initiation factor IF-2 [Gemmatimonadetes bacterium]|nr:translation initiation factor IF-2 [Gemmatimonadota bacterium]
MTTKLRVTDLAAEFGIASDEVVAMLRSLDVVVRSHITPLADDQVARARTRWEREKRTRAANAAAPASAPARRRRTTGSTATTPADEASAPKAKSTAAAKPKAKSTAKTKAARSAEGRKAFKAPKASKAKRPAKTEEVVEELPKTAPTTRRRKAADLPPPVEIGVDEHVSESDISTDTGTVPVLAEVARTATDAPAGDEMTVAPEAASETTPVAARTSVPAASGAAPRARPAAAVPATPPAVPRPAEPARPRPRPVVPGAPRGRQGVAGLSFPPRPVASASPGVPGGGITRRDDRTGRSGPPSGTGAPMPSSGRRKKGKRGQVDQQAVSANIFRTMKQMSGGSSKRRRPDEVDRDELDAMRAAQAEVEKKTVRVNEFITVSELAGILKIPATQIVSFAFKHLGLMVTINQRLDFDQIELIASEFGYNAVREEEYAASVEESPVDTPESLKPRPPIVTIMGHVDHGKTSLLDYIRKANVATGEAGGITQHIGAYHVTTATGKDITFLDTPGHEAFTAMRARGAQVTDTVILVVAADDSVMPQTIEAISHAKNAGVPIIVAINKIDLPAANVMKVKQELLAHSVVLEEFGGQVLHSEISAKKGTNVDKLLEQILLQAEILDLKANPDRKAAGAVVEAQLDAGKGPVATVLVEAGTLRVGDDFICGLFSGRVRALLDERGKPVKEAGPAMPVQVLGMSGVPMAGDQFLVVEDSMKAREIAQTRERLDREAKSRRTAKGAVSLEDFMAHAASGERRSLKLLIKADQGGPAEALADALAALSTEEVAVEVVQRAVGAITEGDILLAKASGAIIIGFHVRPDNKARTAAEREGVDIRLYKIIYEAVSDVRSALEGMLRPEEKEVILGDAEVRETFKVSKIGTIAGCHVRTGIINRQARVRIVRDGKEVYDGIIASLRRFKDDVKEVKDGFECGIGIENFNDVKVGDVIECYKKESVARTLESASAN